MDTTVIVEVDRTPYSKLEGWPGAFLLNLVTFELRHIAHPSDLKLFLDAGILRKGTISVDQYNGFLAGK